jgi:hypothetical protein
MLKTWWISLLLGTVLEEQHEALWRTARECGGGQHEALIAEVCPLKLHRDILDIIHDATRWTRKREMGIFLSFTSSDLKAA